MATAPKKPSKSGFLRALFRTNPSISRKDAEEAWKEAGHEGEIGESSFYNTKTSFNKLSGGGTDTGGAASAKGKPKSISKGTRARKTTRPVELPAAQPNGRDDDPGPESGNGPEVNREPARTEGHDQVVDEIEDGIDDLIHRLKNIGGKPEILEALRRARRLLYAGQSE